MKKIYSILFFYIFLSHLGFAAFCTLSDGNDCTMPDPTVINSNVTGVTYSTCEGGCDLTFTANADNCNAAATGDMYFVQITTTAACSDLTIDVNSISGDNTQATAMIFTSACETGAYSFVDAGCVTGGDQLTGSTLSPGNYYLAFGGEVGECVTGDFDITIAAVGTPPTNDDCNSPNTLTAGNGINTGGGTADAMNGSTACATNTCTQTLCSSPATSDCFIYTSMASCYLGNVSGSDPRCWGSVENSIFYDFTAPTTGTYTIEMINQTCNTNGLQFLITDVLDCSDAEQTSLGMLNDIYGQPACINQNTTADVFVEVDLVAGTDYYIIVDGFAGAQCSFDLLLGLPTILPVHWGKITADKIADNKAQIQWDIKTDDSKSDYVIYATRDANDVPDDMLKNYNFKEIGRVKFTGENKTYNFVDDKLGKGFNLYYVAKLDAQGRIKYRTRNVEVYNDYMFNNIYVNNNDGVIDIFWEASEDGKFSISMFDINGKIAINETSEYTKGLCNLQTKGSTISAGIYYVTITDKSGNRIEKKILIK